MLVVLYVYVVLLRFNVDGRISMTQLFDSYTVAVHQRLIDDEPLVSGADPENFFCLKV